MCLPACGKSEGVMMGLCRTGKGSASRPGGKAPENNMMSSKRAGVTHRPQTREVHRNFNETVPHKEPINSIFLCREITPKDKAHSIALLQK